MSLSAKEKTKIIENMKNILEKNFDNSIEDTQIRKYAVMATKSDCEAEFFNYMHYQIGRARNNEKPFLIKVLENITPLKKALENQEEEHYLEALAYYFGYMARYKKYLKVQNKNSKKF